MNRVFRKNLVLIILGIQLLLLTSCDMIPNLGETKKILFIGNSYTMTSSIPGVFSKLAKSKGKNIEVEIAASKGGDFFSHVMSASVDNMLQSQKWDYIILQEQTQIPASPYYRDSKMYPAARKLVAKIRSLGAEAVFFQTSGNRNGWPEGGQDNYKSMQQEIINGYSQIANELNVPVAPVGQAWQAAMDKISGVNLWLDGRHPSEQGAYLAACVFYAQIFRDSPEGANYIASLPDEFAGQIQQIAADVVLSNISR
jgi:hypothetical protein